TQGDDSMRHNNGFRRAALATTAVTAFAAAVVLAAMAEPGRMPVTAAAKAVTAVVARAALRKPLLCRMLSSP
ncbi:hypothetical protein PV351_42625, partial [Streptomyces scabiei]|nr:hypothetical protein [Streptomyces scabiei]